MTAPLKPEAKDLSREFPRSPRETLAGYVVAARMLDKCRAAIAGTLGEYHFNCLLDRQFLDFAGIDANQFQAFVATGVDDDAVAKWITEHAKPRPRLEIIKWNNRLRDLRPGDLPDEAQEFLEAYIPQCLPKGRAVYRWFDVYDIEEERL
jgi:hypothetical protein